MTGGTSIDQEKRITERYTRIASPEAQVAEAARNAKTAESLQSETAGLTDNEKKEQIMPNGIAFARNYVSAIDEVHHHWVSPRISDRRSKTHSR